MLYLYKNIVSYKECKDDTECSVVAENHHLMQLCIWVALDISRCGYLSKTVIDPIPTFYDATYVYNICKKTCKACDGIYNTSSASSTPLKTIRLDIMKTSGWIYCPSH